MSHTENSEMYAPRDVDPERSRKKRAWLMSTLGSPLKVVAIEISDRVGEVQHTTIYHLEGGEPCEVWKYDGEVYIIPCSDAAAGRFPWKVESDAAR